MTRITVNLTMQEREALIALAGKELRHPRTQAALIIRMELQRQGLIEVTKLRVTKGSEVSTEKEGVTDVVANENA